MRPSALVLATLLLAGLPGAAGAVILVDALDTPGRAKKVVVAGGLVYVADGSGGLRILDPSVPGGREVGSLPLPAEAEALALAGGLAYVAANEAGLVIVDVSDPAQPSQLAALDTAGLAQSVALDGQRAYLADGSAGLSIVDVSNPLAPLLLGSFDTPGGALDVEVRAGLAYLADGFSGLRILDVSDPAAPRQVGASAPLGFARDVALAGTLAYVAAEVAGLQILDVSSPAQPVELSLVDLPGAAWAVAVRGGFAYVAGLQEGITTIDVSTPAAPRVRVRFEVGNAARGVALDGPRLYVADNLAGVRILDVTWPATPSAIANDVCGRTLRQDDSILLVFGCGFPVGLATFDISDPSAPIELDRLPVSGATDALDVRGVTYLWGYFSGLRLVDTSDPMALRELPLLPTPGRPRTVVLSGARLFVAGDLPAPHIYDVADPAQPFLFTTLPFFGGVTRVDGTVVFSGSNALDLGPEYGSPVVISLGRTSRIDSHGVLRVTLFGSDWLDVVEVDVPGLRLSPAAVAPLEGRSRTSDADGDGRLDLELWFRRSLTGIEPGTKACLYGETHGDVALYGCDLAVGAD